MAKTPARRNEPVPEQIVTVDEERFIVEYFRVGNATKAFLLIWPFTTRAQAKVKASRLMAQPHVQKALDVYRERLNRRFGITRERVMQSYARLAWYDVRLLFNEDGKPKAPHELDEDTAFAIQGMDVLEVDQGKDKPPATMLKFKLASRKDALDAIMRANGWNKEKPETDINPLMELLKQIGQRSAMPIGAMHEVIDQDGNPVDEAEDEE